MLFEYIADGGFNWVYFVETKAHFVSRFFDLQTYLLNNSIRSQYNYFFNRQGDFLKMQGVTKGRYHYEVSQEFIDKLTNKILRYDNNN